MKARQYLEDVRKEVEPLKVEILRCPFLTRAERGEITVNQLRTFVENLLYMVPHDARSYILMASRANDPEEAKYFAELALGELEAFEALKEMANELDIGLRPLHEMKIIPHVIDYTHFLAFLATHRNPGEQVFALLVDFPVWSAACSKLLSALKNMNVIRNVKFLELFSDIPGWIEERGLHICERYVERHGDDMRFFALLMEKYELGFWKGLLEG